jgi:hypothetical protein
VLLLPNTFKSSCFNCWDLINYVGVVLDFVEFFGNDDQFISDFFHKVKKIHYKISPIEKLRRALKDNDEGLEKAWKFRKFSWCFVSFLAQSKVSAVEI